MTSICFIVTYSDGRKEHIWARNYLEACKQVGPNAFVAIAQSFLGGSGSNLNNLSDNSFDKASWLWR